MIIIGCDYHPGFQQIAFVDTDTGELQERRLEHCEEAERFYRDLGAQGAAERVQCGKQIASYLGLVPLEDSSGQRRRLGHITKQGNSLLRFLLVEAAQVTVRSLPEWRSKFFHLAMRRTQERGSLRPSALGAPGRVSGSWWKKLPPPCHGESCLCANLA
jgi:hypothetical protein